MDVLKNLNNSVDYIEEHLCDEIDMNEISRIACLCPDGFKRFFSYMTNMTIHEYIRRRRLTLAAFDLQNGDFRVIDVAVKYLYSSADSFSRAFFKQHGITPNQARNSDANFIIYPPVSFHINIKGGEKMNFKLVELKETEVYGISRQTDLAAGERFDLERNMWADDCEHIPEKICSGYDGVWYGIWNNGTYAISRENKDTDFNNLERHIIPAGKYAMFTTEKGGYAGDALPKLRDLIFNSWLPSSDYVQSFDYELEIYHLATNREERRKNRYYEILIPVEKKA